MIIYKHNIFILPMLVEKMKDGSLFDSYQVRTTIRGFELYLASRIYYITATNSASKVFLTTDSNAGG